MVVTAITKDNILSFQNLIPGNLRDMDYPGRGMLGLIDEASGGKYNPIGVLIFDIEDEPLDNEGIITLAKLKWLYVLEEFRGKDIADYLIQDFFKLLDSMSIAVILCDVPWNSNYDSMCSYLEKWGFESTIDELGTVQLKLSELVGIKEVPCSDVLALGDIPKSDFISYFEKVPIDERPNNIFEKYHIYDKELSCAIRNKDGITGLVLVYSCSEDYIDIDYFYVDSKGKFDLLKLISFTYSRVGKRFKADTVINIECRNDVTATALDYFIVGAEPALARRYAFNMLGGEE